MTETEKFHSPFHKEEAEFQLYAYTRIAKRLQWLLNHNKYKLWEVHDCQLPNSKSESNTILAVTNEIGKHIFDGSHISFLLVSDFFEIQVDIDWNNKTIINMQNIG